MTKDELQQLLKGEQTDVQYKERLLDNYDIGCEIVAFCNSRGGRIVFGVVDKTGEVNPLSYIEVQETTNNLTNIATDNVIPNVLIDVEVVPVDGGSLVVATIKEGLNKPYRDNKGFIWVKNGADKRRITDNFEIAEMLQQCGTFAPDQAFVKGATIDDLDMDTFKEFLANRFQKSLSLKGYVDEKFTNASIDEICRAIASTHTPAMLLRNMNFIVDGKLTVAAMLLFGKFPQRWLPTITAKCISYFGNSVGGSQFRDKVPDGDMEGNLLHQYETIMAFFSRNLKNVQVEKDFNAPGQLEVPYSALVEITVNALVHRSLNWRAPIRIFIFDDRIEIHSPGNLPNGLTVEDVVSGASLPRNNFLFNNAVHLLPYTGVGSGIRRALDDGAVMQFKDDTRLHEFITVIPRNADSDTLTHDHDTHSSDHDTNHDTFEGDHDIFKTDHDTDHDNQRRKLTQKEKDIVNFCSIPRSSKEILERVGVSYHSTNVQKYVTALVEAGYLEPTNPNPSASNQKYRKKRR